MARVRLDAPRSPPTITTLHSYDRFRRIREDRVAREVQLDGIYLIRTNVPPTQMSADDAVRTYKALSQVERAFRSLKTIDLHVRPIHRRVADLVRSHIFLCMLAYCVE